MARVSHHDIDLILRPEVGELEAVDALTIAGDDGPLFLHFNSRLVLTSVKQVGRQLTASFDSESDGVRRYRIEDWAAGSAPVTVRWSGRLDRFEGYKVTIISPDCIELSGFGNWFPTVERQSQLEQFTYDLRIQLPSGWQVVTPGFSAHRDTLRMVHSRQTPIEDILICAAPAWQRAEVRSGPSLLTVLARGFSDQDMARLADDFRAAVAVVAGHFGPMSADCGGTFVVTPRGPEAADWGYERGDIWVVGDEFVRALLANDWCLPWAPGPQSLALHETIHAWFGQALRFSQPWLVEALTQYLQVVLTEEMFARPGLSDGYFEWYRSRIAAKPEQVSRPASAMAITDSMYTCWYLKGSWAFWDIEAAVGRGRLLAAIAACYGKHVGTTIDAATFCRELESALGLPLREHFAHWFDAPGFAPRCRA